MFHLPKKVYSFMPYKLMGYIFLICKKSFKSSGQPHNSNFIHLNNFLPFIF